MKHLWFNWHKLLQTAKWISLFTHFESGYFVIHMLKNMTTVVICKPFLWWCSYRQSNSTLYLDLKNTYFLKIPTYFPLRFLWLDHKNMLTNSTWFKMFRIKYILGNVVRYMLSIIFLWRVKASQEHDFVLYCYFGVTWDDDVYTLLCMCHSLGSYFKSLHWQLNHPSGHNGPRININDYCVNGVVVKYREMIFWVREN